MPYRVLPSVSRSRSRARAFVRRRAGVAPVAALAAATLLGGAVPALADDVHLHNGEIFEDVVAEVTDSHVIVELAIGRLRFPVDQVREVVRSESALAAFHERRQALLRDPASAVASWVELAEWARARGLERAWRETALLAARLDGTAAGLEPLMRELGYELDETAGWLPRHEAMVRRGLVEYRGSWLAPERVAELRRAEREAAATAAEADRVAAGLRSRRGASDNEVALASIELAREALRDDRAEAAPRPGVPVGQAIFVGGWPWFVGGAAPATPEAREAWDALAVRQPGSIIPLETFKRQLPR